MIFRQLCLGIILMAICTLRALAAAIPADHVGPGKWVTLKTEYGYYFCAIRDNGVYKLGQSTLAPTATNYAAYCWQIEGDEATGYTFRCLGYMDYNAGAMDYSHASDPGQNLYITDPATVAVANYEVRLTTSPSRYNYTDNHQLQLRSNTSLYLAFYSSRFHTIRLHNSADYVGSKMVIGGVYDWSVAAVVYGTETIGLDGIPQGTYLPGGGITYSGQNYLHGSSLYLADVSNLTIIPIEGYQRSTIKIDHDNRYIVAYYIGNQSGITYSSANTNKDSHPVVTGADNTIWSLDAQDYITNTSGNYTSVPADKAWQMEMVVQNTHVGASDPSFNRWGSCILSSNGDPINTYYWGDFQVYQHAPTHASPNTLNFKSSKADGNDHIIAQGASVAGRNYKVIVRYNGQNVYIIRTIMLDAKLQETNDVYNNVWVSARQQNAISQLSCALPAGLNLHSLRISIAEESNLMEGVDYAIQNVGNRWYFSDTNTQGDVLTPQFSAYAGDAEKVQIEWTGLDDLTYTELDGALHHSFYIRVGSQYLGSTGMVNDCANAQPYIYTTSLHLAPITAKNTLGTAWSIDGQEAWYFDFFANFYVEVAGHNAGGLTYTKGGEKQIATNGQYVELPSGVQVAQLANSSQLGYSAAISKADIRLKVQYTALDEAFYTFTSRTNPETSSLFFWYKSRPLTPSLISYSTKNSQSGKTVEWGEKGDCSKFTILKATTIPVKMSGVTNAQGNTDYYGSIYLPVGLALPDGVIAYRLDRVTAKRNFLLKDMGVTVLPAYTPAVLVLRDGHSNPADVEWTLRNNNTLSEPNLFLGVVEDASNPGYGQEAQSTVYMLSNKTQGIGFYPYSAENIPAFKAYYVFPATQAEGAPSRFGFAIEVESDSQLPTDIEEMEDLGMSLQDILSGQTQSPIYDIYGRRVARPLPGHMYIVDGKKIIL